MQAANTEWHVWNWKVNANKCGLPQVRVWTFVCGRKASAFTHAIPRFSPSSSAKIQQVEHMQILDAGLPSQVASLKASQKANLDAYIAKREQVRARHPHMAEVNHIAIFDLGRADGKKRPQKWRADNQVMCLTAHSCCLFDSWGSPRTCRSMPATSPTRRERNCKVSQHRPRSSSRRVAQFKFEHLATRWHCQS